MLKIRQSQKTVLQVMFSVLILQKNRMTVGPFAVWIWKPIILILLLYAYILEAAIVLLDKSPLLMHEDRV